MDDFYQLFVYVPETHLDIVKKAIFEAGAGKAGNYSCCAWQAKGIGQFLPEEGSKPAVGKIGELEKCAEYKLESICKKECLPAVIESIKLSHPYEMPAFGFLELVNPKKI